MWTALFLSGCVQVFVHPRWSTSTVSHIGGVDESAQHTFFTSSKRQFVQSVADRCLWRVFFVEIGPDNMERHRVLLQVADLHRFVIVHLDETSYFIHHLQSALLLKTVNEHLQEAITPHLLVRQKLEGSHEILASTLFRMLPTVLAAARRAPPSTLFLL